MARGPIWFDRMMIATERRFFPTSRAWVCSRAKGRTLEVGIGTGLNLPHYGSDVDLVGLDPSAEMLEIARGRAKDAGISATMMTGDAMELPFPDASFDTVVSTFVLCEVPNDVEALLEMTRVLRTGGQLLLADHVESTSTPIRWGQRALEAITRRVSGEYFTRRPSIWLNALNTEIRESERLKRGVIEHVAAVRYRS